MKRERINDDRADDDPDMDLIDELETGLAIDEHAIDESLQRQPDLYYRVSKALALLSSRRDAAKQEIANVEAEVENEIRKGLARRDEKITDKAVAAQLRTTPRVQKAMSNYLRLNLLVGQCGALKEAYQQRSYALRSMVDLHVSNYFETGSITRQHGRERDHRAERAKRRMSDARRDR